MIVVGVIAGSVFGYALGNRAEASGYRRLPASRRWAAIVTALLRSFAFGIPTGAALGGMDHGSPFAAVGLALLSFTAAYTLSGPMMRIVTRRRNAGSGAVLHALTQAALGSGAAAVGVLLGGALVPLS